MSQSRFGERLSRLESSLSQFIQEVRRRDEETDARLDKLVTTLEHRSQTPWRLILGFAAFALTVMGLAAQPFLQDMAEAHLELREHREQLHELEVRLAREGLEAPACLAGARPQGLAEVDFDPALTDFRALRYAEQLRDELVADLELEFVVEVRVGGLAPDRLGQASHRLEGGYLIELQSGLGRNMLVAVMVHEFGHVLQPRWADGADGHGDAWALQAGRAFRAMHDLGEFAVEQD